MVVLAIRTGIAPDVWRRQTDDDIEMAFVLLQEQDRPDDSPEQGYSG